jgi:hypothetical protein
VLLALFVGAAAAGVFGVRTRTVSATGTGMSARLQYATVNRRGVTTPWRLFVHRAGGFPHDVHVWVSLSYLDTIDARSLDPQPQSSVTDAAMIEYTFTRPRGPNLTVRLDGSIDASASPGRHRGIAVVNVGDAPSLRLRFTTWVLP